MISVTITGIQNSTKFESSECLSVSALLVSKYEYIKNKQFLF